MSTPKSSSDLPAPDAVSENGKPPTFRSKTFGHLDDFHRNNFDFLRFFLASMVMWSHCFFLRDADNHREPFVVGTHGQVDGGALAVDFFFVISGFLITHSWLHSRGFLDYLKKRILRIHPGFMVSVLFCSFVVGPLATSNLSFFFEHGELLRRIVWAPLNLSFGLPDKVVFDNVPVHYAIDAPTWTIKYEFQCYLLLAGLGLAGCYRKRISVLALLVLALGLYGLQEGTIVGRGWFHHEQGYRLFSFFLAGICFYLFREKIPYSGRLALGCAAVLALTLYGLRIAVLSQVLLPVLGSYILLYLAFSSSLRLQNFGRCGDFSYGMYLYHFPILQLFIQHFGPAVPPYVLLVSAYPIVLVLAILSWNLVEHPFLKLKKARLLQQPRLKSTVVSDSGE